MKAHKRIMILLFYVLPLPMSFAASPEQCYSYFTELVRSSCYPFNEWNVKPKEVNLMIDDDDDSIIRAKLVIDTNGTGTIGWVLFKKAKQNCLI